MTLVRESSKILVSMGLKQVMNSSCIFAGIIVKGQPPLYVGLYVDDFMYFSESPTVEKAFENKFSNELKVTWEGDIAHI